MDLFKHKKAFRIFWIIAAGVVVLSMMAFLVAPLF